MNADTIITAMQAPCEVSVRDINVNPLIGASIGISIYPKDVITAEALISSADETMYRAKLSKSGYAFDRRSRVRPLCGSARYAGFRHGIILQCSTSS